MVRARPAPRSTKLKIKGPQNDPTHPTHPRNSSPAEKKTYTARDPVLGATGEHSTKFGARAAAAWRRVKSVVPGTKPYRARHGGAPHELHA